jgi:hypothetical protein
MKASLGSLAAVRPILVFSFDVSADATAVPSGMPHQLTMVWAFNRLQARRKSHLRRRVECRGLSDSSRIRLSGWAGRVWAGRYFSGVRVQAPKGIAGYRVRRHSKLNYSV